MKLHREIVEIDEISNGFAHYHNNTFSGFADLSHFPNAEVG